MAILYALQAVLFAVGLAVFLRLICPPIQRALDAFARWLDGL